VTGIEKANGRRPHGVLDVIHPALQGASRADQAKLGYDLDRVLDAVFKVHAQVPGEAFTATILGTEREGNGVLIDDTGLVLTIGYLISEAETVTLIGRDGKEIGAEPIAYDHETGFGMARAVEPLGVDPVTIGRSADLVEADPVVVASFGGASHAITANVVSIHEFAGAWEYMLDEAIYTAPMHSYWGGAALIDRAGALVGTGSLYIEHSVDGGTAIPGNMFVPIDLLAPIRDSMVRTGRADRAMRPWLGMYVSEADGRLIVTGVAPNAPADQAGMEPGDIVLSLEGVPVEGLGHYYRTLWAAGGPGTGLRFTILRDDDVISVRVKAGDRYDYLKLPRRH
jgi:S1-C subfamily serine protease